MQRIRLEDLPRVIEREQQRARDGVTRAVASTTIDGARLVRRRIPVALGPLRDSAHATPTAIVVDAPHAAAVEVGSRPHVAPLGPLIEWVKLRGTQGLTTLGRVARTVRAPLQARRVARQIKNLEVRASRRRSVPADAVLQIAKRIQAAIAAKGTRPQWFARSSIPDVVEILDQQIKKELRK